MKIKIVAVASTIALAAILVGQQFSSVPGQGRSMVVTKYGIVAALQFLASQAGAHFWKKAEMQY